MCLNNGYRFSFQYGPKDQLSGVETRTILDFLAARFPHSSLEEWQERIEAGEISVGLSAAVCDPTRTPEFPLKLGHHIIWERPPWKEPDAPQVFDYLYEDHDLVVVHKPSGLPTLPGGGFFWNTLLYQVQKSHPTATPLHRLGRATSGVVLFALNKNAASFLTRRWPSFHKGYVALAAGSASQQFYEIKTPIGPVKHPRLGTVHAACPDGKFAHSSATVVTKRADSTIFEVALHTGRPHQIRIHLASIGHPLVGDPLYASGGNVIKDLPGLPGDGGYWLHAKTLKVIHPTSLLDIGWTALPPPILQ